MRTMILASGSLWGVDVQFQSLPPILFVLLLIHSTLTRARQHSQMYIDSSLLDHFTSFGDKRCVVFLFSVSVLLCLINKNAHKSDQSHLEFHSFCPSEQDYASKLMLRRLWNALSHRYIFSAVLGVRTNRASNSHLKSTRIPSKRPFFAGSPQSVFDRRKIRFNTPFSSSQTPIFYLHLRTLASMCAFWRSLVKFYL